MERTEKIPVLILSGSMVPLDEARFKASGARGVLFKPFESREMQESIERLLRETPPAPEARKPLVAPAADERWDFSDVMNEVEAEARGSAAPAPMAREELLPGAILPGGAKVPPGFNEFDVSIDEIEGRPPDFFAESPPPAPKVEHMEPGLPMDSPPPVTDLSSALEEVEEIAEIGHLEAVETPMPPADAVSAGTPASLRVLSAVTGHTGAEEPVPVVDEPIRTSPEAVFAPHDAGARPGDAELREFFAGRAAEIFRTVASEAVEKVMWEMSDRLAVEFSAKLRESVEAVAWEVIPSTAEALIREEIARIRGQAGKHSP
jgi:hypothetical protein